MTSVGEPRRRRAVSELPLAVVFEEVVSASNGRNVQVRITVIVRVRERGCYADMVSQADVSR